MDFSRRDVSLTVALCASLVLHALLLFKAAEVYSDYLTGMFPFPAFEIQQPDSSTHLLTAAVPPDPWNRLGDSTGTGSAIADAPGDRPLIAPKSNQDQPFLSLDPAGPGNIGEDPSESLLPKGTAPTPAPQELAQEPAPALPFGFAMRQGDSPVPIAPKTNLTPPASGSSDSAQTDGTPGANSAADPAPRGTLESDPTTVVGGVEFRAGATDVRLGRAAKITRPRLTLAARSDLISGARPIIVLKIRTDPSGNVTHAEIFRSSGSLNVDQPCKLAAYNWWFEPPKDASGKSLPDIFLFSIRFI